MYIYCCDIEGERDGGGERRRGEKGQARFVALTGLHETAIKAWPVLWTHLNRHFNPRLPHIPHITHVTEFFGETKREISLSLEKQ